MMSEIVTRLRDYQQWLDDDQPINDFIADIKGDKTCQRAADEIEILEKIIKAIASNIHKWRQLR